MAKRWVRATTLLLVLAACTPTKESAPVAVAPPTPPIRLSVGSVEVTSVAQLPANMNFIGRRRSEALAQEAQTFLRSHIVAEGGADFARATVEEASIIERARATEGGVLSTEPTWEMVGVLALKVAVVDGLGIEQSFASSQGRDQARALAANQCRGQGYFRAYPEQRPDSGRQRRAREEHRAEPRRPPDSLTGCARAKRRPTRVGPAVSHCGEHRICSASITRDAAIGSHVVGRFI